MAAFDRTPGGTSAQSRHSKFVIGARNEKGQRGPARAGFHPPRILRSDLHMQLGFGRYNTSVDRNEPLLKGQVSQFEESELKQPGVRSSGASGPRLSRRSSKAPASLSRRRSRPPTSCRDSRTRTYQYPNLRRYPLHLMDHGLFCVFDDCDCGDSRRPAAAPPANV